MRTYAGHSDARRSNELYRSNLAKGQTGLSVALSTANNALVYELRVPLKKDADHPFAVGASAGATIGIGVQSLRSRSVRLPCSQMAA